MENADIQSVSPTVERTASGAAATSRRRVLFIAWGQVSGRSEEIARALGGEARAFYPLRIARRSLVPLRYLLSALQTAGYLARQRPHAVIVTNPPIFPALIAYAYLRLTGGRLVLDSHPDSFRDDGPHARFRGVHAWLARRAEATLVTTDDLGAQVRAWDGTPIVVHEAPPADGARTARQPGVETQTVLVLGSLSVDEPVEEVLAGAREQPKVVFAFTGDIRRCPPEQIASAPTNVTFLGYLGPAGYAAALDRATVVVVLTTWLQWAVPRSAYDAVYAQRPLVVSDSPHLRALFPFAIPVANDAASIARGVAEALRRRDELVRDAPAALAVQLRRWNEQLARLQQAVGAA